MKLLNFLSKLYTKENVQRPTIENLFPIQFSTESKELLEKAFNEEEIKEGVFAMDKAKSPGPDGFSMHFFQSC